MSLTRFLCVAFVLSLGVVDPDVASAQQAAQDSILQTDPHRALTNELHRHQKARMRQHDTEWVEADGAVLEGNDLVFRPLGAAQDSTLPLNDISEIQVRKSSSGRGAKYGALIGCAFNRWDTVFEEAAHASSHRLSSLDATSFAVTVHF